jgi:acylphosphatase
MEQILLRKHIWVTGRVQGVGFRAFTQYVASSLEITGWVRNMNYDQVEIMAEGEEQPMLQFIQAVKNGPTNSVVQKMTVDDETPSHEWFTFNIRS